MIDFEVTYETVTLAVPTQASVPVLSIADWVIWMNHYLPNAFDWHLTWNDYKNGFGSSTANDDFWLRRRDWKS